MTELGPPPSPPPSTARVANPFLRILLLAAGGVFVAIGVVGIFVPLLPTTIFLLIAAACFGKSSPGAHRWLMNNRWFGRYLNDYTERRGATRATKITSLVLLWLGIGAAIYFFFTPLWLVLALLGIAVAVSAHLLLLDTLRR
jgi:uncharacterized membrane protein YbaN (DUF454 family)